MRHGFLFVLTGIFLFGSLLKAQDREILRFIYCSDVHYGLEREFRGAVTPADSVSRAMLASFRMLENETLPEDGGVAEGEIFGKPDFIACTGDIANRMENGVQTATESWEQFCRDWEMTEGIPLYLVPGNHDISNAIGYPQPLSPERDDASAAGIYRMMSHTSDDGTFDHTVDKTHFSFVMDSIRFVFMGMWPDSHMRAWYENESWAGDGLPVMIFTHDPPDADTKHFTNPNGKHDINPADKFQNLLSDTCCVRNVSQKAENNWRELEKFLRSHPEIKAYFHGDRNYNEFYTWHGVDGTISLPVFRVDSPMKGFVSSSDETLVSFIAVTIDHEARTMTARECLWNADMKPGLDWGESRTIAF